METGLVLVLQGWPVLALDSQAVDIDWLGDFAWFQPAVLQTD